MFSKSVVLAAFAATVSVVAQDISAAQMVSNINQLTTLTNNTLQATNGAYLDNPIGARQDVIGNFTSITTQATDYVNQMSSSSKNKRYSGSIAARATLEQRDSTYTADEQQQISDAYTSLTNVGQDLMFSVLNKHFVVEAHGLAYQVADAMKAESSAVDKFSAAVIEQIPNHATDSTTQRTYLGSSSSKVTAYYANGSP
ncbi:MAG: hypothetical protein M1821_009285 [Bathelium mastoideum]|nr:MAG: hypothetical protein M1821_009285 [Bathelium mastoideum]KAI9686907.1 MAG: hypothetical protein M1822_002660 [Bathelium mastoideum]